MSETHVLTGPPEGAPIVDEKLAEVPEAGPALRLKRMQIHGFKSFCDRTEVVFPVGITAIVGPNGCGKSNIGDALNWVLGEQSPKLLRGSKMMDVIFNGSEGRKPLGMAEVSLHLRNLDAAPGSAEEEIVLTRRLFRSGESEYLLNGARARLKDIQEILRRSHVGAKTYATIEQGRIDSLLNAKPRDRRQIIEDAAGISGFKHKRRLAELKLEATEANLLRVNDVIVEVRRQINSLKRQAAKARRYKKLREQLRDCERVRFGLKARAMDEQLAGLRAREARARDAESQAAGELARMETRAGEDREALEQAEAGFRETARRFHQMEAEVDRQEERIRLFRERIEEAREAAQRFDTDARQLSERIAALAGEIDAGRRAHDERREQVERCGARLQQARQKLAEADEAVDGLRRKVETLRAELFQTMNRAAEARNGRRALDEMVDRNRAHGERLAEEKGRLDGEMAEARREEEQVEGLLAAARDEERQAAARFEELDQGLKDERERMVAEGEALAAARAAEEAAATELKTLEDLHARFAGLADGVRDLLESDEAGTRAGGVLADYVRADRSIEGAAETYLGDLLPAVVMESDADAVRAAVWLRSRGHGRTRLVARDHPGGEPVVGGGAIPAAALADPRARGRLRDRLSFDAKSNGFIADRIGDAVVVDSLEHALQLHREHPGCDFLTEGGEVVFSSGLVLTGGDGAGEHGLLAHRRKTQEAREAFGRAQTRAAALLQQVEALRRRIVEGERGVTAQRQTLEQTRQRVVDLDLRYQRMLDERARGEKRNGLLEHELGENAEERRTLERDRQAAAEAVRRAEEAHAAAEERVAEAARELESRESAVRTVAEEVAALGAELEMRREKRSAVESQQRHLEDTRHDVEDRLAGAHRDAEGARVRTRETGDRLQRAESELVEQLKQREACAGRVAREEQALTERRTALNELEEQLRRQRTTLDGLRQESGAAEIERTRFESDRTHLDDLARQELGISAGQAARDAGEELDGATLEQLEPQIAEIRGKLERIGPVNIMAIEEFSDLEERHDFLSTQKDDLERSIASLRETIRKINRTSRERFAEAFEIIRHNYQEIFKVLFNGGRADLRLEEEVEDVLEAGIEILAQPPGKRLSSVQLMSGGEKAMAAIALLFAIFRHQPSPFCLLDEVDAALDDVNILRFTRMVKEYAAETQFILVTHNKLSMESAELLYGVTMEQPGVSKLVSMQVS